MVSVIDDAQPNIETTYQVLEDSTDNLLHVQININLEPEKTKWNYLDLSHTAGSSLFKPECEALGQRPNVNAKGLHPYSNNFFVEFLLL